MRTLDEKTVEKIIEYFDDYISNMSWDEWCSTPLSDWDELVTSTIIDLQLTNYIDEVYDIFNEWIEGIDETYFK